MHTDFDLRSIFDTIYCELNCKHPTEAIVKTRKSSTELRIAS